MSGSIPIVLPVINKITHSKLPNKTTQYNISNIFNFSKPSFYPCHK